MASTSDIQVASLAAGFTIGFGFLTVWEAMKQTRRNRNPLRSVYIYMVWGEVAANLAIGIIGWLFLDGILGPTVPVLFSLLFCWVFEIQLLMQIIINRISIIAEHRKTIEYLKWGTAGVITTINIAVFCIWIPAHMSPPVNETYVRINEYWDRTSKILILIVDAGLNYYFLRTVKLRLVKQHGLVKYAPLVSFNAKLMVLSICMDAMLIGLMSLPNQVVYIQFHPVTYMVKLNIELSMASLITRLARNHNDNDFYHPSMSYSRHGRTASHDVPDRGHTLKSFHKASVGVGNADASLENGTARAAGGIHQRMDVEVTVEESSTPSLQGTENGDVKAAVEQVTTEDELSLTRNAGHPNAAAKKGRDVDGRTVYWE